MDSEKAATGRIVHDGDTTLVKVTAFGPGDGTAQTFESGTLVLQDANSSECGSAEGAVEDMSLAGQSLSLQCPEAIKPPLVSFILRNSNYAEYLGSAIDSIKRQDYPRFE